MSRKLSKWDTLRTRLPSACLLEETGLVPVVEAQKYEALARFVYTLRDRKAEHKNKDNTCEVSPKVCIGGLEGLVEEMGADKEFEKVEAGENEMRANKEREKAEAGENEMGADKEFEKAEAGENELGADKELEKAETDVKEAPSSPKLVSSDDGSQVEAEVVDGRLVDTKPYVPSRLGARNRWKRLRNTVAFANHLARAANHDLLEEKVHDPRETKTDAEPVGTPAVEGAKSTPQQVKARGRRGMEGLIVEQDKGYISYFQDFYVACLKLPAFHFFVSVFFAPVALALIFTPFYLSDSDGLKAGDSNGDAGSVCDLSNKWNCMNVLLYSLSLSTTFGGSPVAAVSPFCLLVANIHTLMAQFLFVFLSGAVFARMSQPAHPIRCSKKAIIKNNDFAAADRNDEDGKSKVFVVRMVLTGPPPCELVDAKIRLTFRLYMRLPSGSMFCSTQDLELVRSEVAYLRYGITVRHVINSKSPIYGHTLDSLAEGDASFSLTVMGVERSSMQPIFHLEDYFVCDGDVIWDGDYLDFVRVNDKGQRVLEHSKIDMLKPFKVAGVVSQAISRMEGEVARHKEKNSGEQQSFSELSKPATPSHIRQLWKNMSTSFTRALGT